jgi:two-component system chemotaxis response regulator CheB
MAARKIKVLIVDDSALIRHILKESLSRDAEIEICGLANDPYIARDILVRERPDVIILDIEMPKMDGLTFLKTFMQIIPTPTIILSALSEKGKSITLEALEAGAIEVFCKPKLDLSNNLPLISFELIKCIKQCAKIDFSRFAINKKNTVVQVKHKPFDESTDKIIAFGASTGGVEALARILPLFPPATPGIVIVEHMPAGFTGRFAQRLNEICLMRVKEAEEGDRIRKGLILIAPGGENHMVVKRSGGEYRISLTKGSPLNGHCPSVDILFNSLAEEAGKNALAVLMTGMGSDGAKGLLKIRQAGGKTFIQNEETCVIFGMPGAALKLGAANESVPLLEIPEQLLKFIN